ncbi:hypothetical protein [Emcibacter sp.]|uniref:hypothetical protein n=1 Tax=Emcibacter sp. TaxID=1979954 RepID=UPI003A8FDAAB
MHFFDMTFTTDKKQYLRFTGIKSNLQIVELFRMKFAKNENCIYLFFKNPVNQQDVRITMHSSGIVNIHEKRGETEGSKRIIQEPTTEKLVRHVATAEFLFAEKFPKVSIEKVNSSKKNIIYTPINIFGQHFRFTILCIHKDVDWNTPRIDQIECNALNLAFPDGDYFFQCLTWVPSNPTLKTEGIAFLFGGSNPEIDKIYETVGLL